MDARDSSGGPRKTDRILLASSNEGKLREYRRLAAGGAIELDLLPDFDNLPALDESAPTFAENSAGKALHYSQFTSHLVLADDSGLVVPALGGAPGARSARYAGPGATDADRNQKLLEDMGRIQGEERSGRFVCVIAVARGNRTLAVTSDFTRGTITLEPRGRRGFGYDPVFFSPELGRTFGESSDEDKDRVSHRGKAFRRLLEFL